MYNSMKILINRRYFKDYETAQKKLDVFYTVGRLSDDEYVELSSLAKSKY